MTYIRDSRDRVPFCPGCGCYLSANGHHRADCTAPDEVTELEGLTNIADAFGPHLTPDSAVTLVTAIAVATAHRKGTHHNHDHHRHRDRRNPRR